MRVLVTKFQKVERVAFASEGTHLFASGLHTYSLGYGDPDSGIDVFDLAAGSEPAAHLLDAPINWFASLPNGRVAASRYTDLGDSGYSDSPTLGIIDWRSGREDLATLNGWKMWHPSAAGPRGQLISVLISNQANRTGRGPITFERGVGCWQLSSAGEPRADWPLGLGNDRHVFAIAFAPDGQSFWTAEWMRSEATHRWHMKLVPRDATTGKPLRDPILYPNQKISGLALSDTHAVAHDGPTLFAYDLADLDRKPKKLTNPAKRKHFGGFALHPSGKWLAAAGLDGAVTLWDTATWAVARSWVWDAGQARSVCFSADGTLAAAGTDSGKIVVWDLDV